MKNIDMFSANKDFATRVASFVDLKVLRAEYAEDYRVQVASTKKLIDNTEKLKGSIFEESIPERLAMYEQDLTMFKQAYESKLEKMDKFELTDEEKKLRKALKGVSCDDTKVIKQALRDFFDLYGLKITGTDFENSLMNALGGKVDMRKFVKTEGTDGISFNTSGALNIIFWVTFNYMVSAGTIKAASIPDCLKDKYIKKDGKVNKAVADAQK
jgi:hypothetical protein